MSNNNYTKETDEIVLRLTGEGFSAGMIGAQIGRSKSSVTNRLGRLRAMGIEIPVYVTNQPRNGFNRHISDRLFEARVDGEETRSRRRDVTACGRHLEDLIAAGHSPEQTEIYIAPERNVPMRVSTPSSSRSLIGSFAAMCTELAR